MHERNQLPGSSPSLTGSYKPNRKIQNPYRFYYPRRFQPTPSVSSSTRMGNSAKHTSPTRPEQNRSIKTVAARIPPLIRVPIAILSREPRFGITVQIRQQLVKISRSTVERFLKPERKNHIPVNVFQPWDEQIPEGCEISTVSPDGGNSSGSFANLRFDFTLTVPMSPPMIEERDLKNKNKAHPWVRQPSPEPAYSPKRQLVLPQNQTHG
ncbi:hypothetical protein Holit_00763 [Hollandina sp. SP2]